MAIENAEPHFFLKLADLHGQGRLADVNRLGGPAEVTVVIERENVLELLECHG
jgi:hypothetical protein